ncbi:hypothetical protein STHERM_c03380 [Spirochaeta thermophila DSM 6192]|uniref:Uncharacterized protein n=1 Tax=Winmispira thermophila (strain ATCC 49972 / DSM 6192 / RI 19.B1) TaxID=665571 RepID=E0RPB7_WINT6|nr:hypothetical protein STHERM_c03380 [Spirochaeta thermophila DSM 6192]
MRYDLDRHESSCECMGFGISRIIRIN